MGVRLGILGRADRGGIAAQTLSVARNLDVAAALIIELGVKGRGPMNLDPWREAVPDVRVTESFPASDADLDWIVERSDAIYAPEGPIPYRDQDFLDRCSTAGVPFYVHVNPELWRDSYRSPASRLLLPTGWHADRFPDATLLPMPVDRARFPYRERTGRTFLFVGAPAMLDRNGWKIVHAAARLTKRPTRIVTRGLVHREARTRQGQTELVHLPPVADHEDVYPDDVDVLLLPRRYGGLSLPMREAASLGMPCVTLDVEPNRSEGPPGWRVEPYPRPRPYPMIGGQIDVYDTPPRRLAALLDEITPEQVADRSREADRWADEHSWETLGPAYHETLTGETR